MESDAKGKLTPSRKRNVVSWIVEAFKTVSTLELRHGAIFFGSVDVLAIDEMSGAFRGGDFNSLGEQSVARTFVEMSLHGEDLHDASHAIYHDKFEEAYQFVPQISADKFPSLQVSGVLSFDLFPWLSIVPKASALADGSFVIDFGDPSY